MTCMCVYMYVYEVDDGALVRENESERGTPGRKEVERDSAFIHVTHLTHVFVPCIIQSQHRRKLGLPISIRPGCCVCGLCVDM